MVMGVELMLMVLPITWASGRKAVGPVAIADFDERAAARLSVVGLADGAAQEPAARQSDGVELPEIISELTASARPSMVAVIPPERLIAKISSSEWFCFLSC